MPFELIRYLAQIEAIQENTILQNRGRNFIVEGIQPINNGVRFIIRIQPNPRSIQQLLDATYPTAIDSQDILNNNWFFLTGN